MSEKSESKYICVICGTYITYEHGGVLCTCGALYCCDTDCIPEKYYAKDLQGHSVQISSCLRCSSLEKGGVYA